jgi:hypothetical protein
MVSSAAKTFCLSDPTPDNRRKAEAAAGLRALTGKAVGAAQKEIARLKAEPAKPRMARDILKKRRRISRERRGGIRLDRAPSHPAECAAMPSVQGQRPRRSPKARAAEARNGSTAARPPDRRRGPSGSRQGDFPRPFSMRRRAPMAGHVPGANFRRVAFRPAKSAGERCRRSMACVPVASASSRRRQTVVVAFPSRRTASNAG